MAQIVCQENISNNLEYYLISVSSLNNVIHGRELMVAPIMHGLHHIPRHWISLFFSSSSHSFSRFLSFSSVLFLFNQKLLRQTFTNFNKYSLSPIFFHLAHAFFFSRIKTDRDERIDRPSTDQFHQHPQHQPDPMIIN